MGVAPPEAAAEAPGGTYRKGNERGKQSLEGSEKHHHPRRCPVQQNSITSPTPGRRQSASGLGCSLRRGGLGGAAAAACLLFLFSHFAAYQKAFAPTRPPAERGRALCSAAAEAAAAAAATTPPSSLSPVAACNVPSALAPAPAKETPPRAAPVPSCLGPQLLQQIGAAAADVLTDGLLPHKQRPPLPRLLLSVDAPQHPRLSETAAAHSSTDTRDPRCSAGTPCWRATEQRPSPARRGATGEGLSWGVRTPEPLPSAPQAGASMVCQCPATCP